MGKKRSSSPVKEGSNKKSKLNSSSTKKAITKTQDILKDYFHGKDLENIERICKEATKDDPPVIFLWKEITPLIAEIEEILEIKAHHLHEIKPPFPLPDPLTPETYKRALLNYIRVPGAALPQNNGCLPCTAGEVGLVSGRAVGLSFHPWFLAFSEARGNNAFPLAEIMVPIPRSNKLSKACESAPFGVPMWV